MFGQIFTNGAVRKYVIYFGSLFDQVYLTRDNAEGDREQTMKVPLNFGPKEKFLARLQGNPDLDREIAIQLPRMAFEVVNIYYDPSRKLAGTGMIKNVDPVDPNKSHYTYNPMPYNIDFNLYIMTKNMEDKFRIVEQILPFFNPDFVGTVELANEISYNIPLILNTVDGTDTYEGSFTERRAIITTLTFTLKGWVFGPTRCGSVIKQAEINIKIPEGFVEDAGPSTPNVVEIVVTPGLTANGEPTSNASLTIDKNLINADDNYGFITDIQEFI